MTRKHLIATLSVAATLGLGLVACSSDAPAEKNEKPEASSGSFGECTITGEAGSIELDTVADGTLTVAAVLPSNGWWNGSSPETINGGFEYCLASNVAHRAGLESVTVQNQSWDQLISASNTNYDMGTASITITEPRKEVFDFSDAYFQSNLGVAIKDGADVTVDNVGEKKIGVLQGNMGSQYVNDTLKPSGGIQQFQSETEMFTALRAGQVDAVVTDTTLALSNTAASNGELVVTGQFELDQEYGIIMPKGTPNLEAVNAAIADMKQDGTFDELSATWLTPLFGVDPNTIPVWN
ncbi:ABC transporter substrate-binding protein [Leucobacter chinensis]|uniref:ABC transporter substrate-binding protein n=1 Tax=Leucobacter chinensis TaxID=2851010 RepID=UPI001C217CDE|nr:ABC transporter substrate-binding protein [Leucobacter chinensis]